MSRSRIGQVSFGIGGKGRQPEDQGRRGRVPSLASRPHMLVFVFGKTAHHLERAFRLVPQEGTDGEFGRAVARQSVQCLHRAFEMAAAVKRDIFGQRDRRKGMPTRGARSRRIAVASSKSSGSVSRKHSAVRRTRSMMPSSSMPSMASATKPLQVEARPDSKRFTRHVAEPRPRRTCP